MSARASDPTAPRPPVTPSWRRPWGLALTLVVVAGAAAGVLPDLLGLDGRTPFAQLAAFRPVLLGGLLAGTVVVGIIARVRRRGAVLAVGLAAVTAVGVAVVAPRAIAALDVPKPDAPPARTLIVLAFNTYEGEADVDAVAEIIRTERPDLVALIETAGRYRDRIAPLLAPLGYRLHTAREQGRDVQSVTAAVHADLGDLAVTVDETTPFPSVEVTGGTLGTLRFVAFHAVAPTPGAVPQWHSDLATLSRWCADRQAGEAIVAGDVNATLDHTALRAAMGTCVDAAERTGAGLVGTWPTSWPRWAGAQIDHVLVTRGIVPETLAVRDIPGSDHRAVLTRLRLSL